MFAEISIFFFLLTDNVVRPEKAGTSDGTNVNVIQYEFHVT